MARTPSVGYLLNHGGPGLTQVIQRTRELKRLTRQLKAIVDEPLCDHIYVANVRDTTLVVGTDSAVWLTRVKYLAPMIIEQIQQIPGMEQIRQIKFRVQPFSAQTPPAPTSGPDQQAPNNNAAEASPRQNLQDLSEKLKDKSES
jgi:hypothetical protein